MELLAGRTTLGIYEQDFPCAKATISFLTFGHVLLLILGRLGADNKFDV